MITKEKREELIKTIVEILSRWSWDVECERCGAQYPGLYFPPGIEKETAEEIIDKLLERKSKMMTEAEQIKENLASYPQQIYELKRKKQEIENQIAEMKDNLDIISINIENKVYSLFQGKRSNQEQRKSKFAELARKDKDYNEVVKKLRDLERQKGLVEIEIERLYNEFKATREQAKILVAELNLIGGGKDEDN